MAPLLQQRRLRAQFAIANATNKEAVYNHQQKLLDAYSEVATNIRAVQNSKDAFSLKWQEVRELHAAVATSNDLYLTGYANYLEVITTQKKEMYSSLIQLYRSLGRGWQ